MVDDKCPYVFCPKCKSSNSWVRDKARDIIGKESGMIMWKGWRCRLCGAKALEPTGVTKSGVK